MRQKSIYRIYNDVRFGKDKSPYNADLLSVYGDQQNISGRLLHAN
ncbi:MAG: DUF2461 family protein [Saprospiraceae bacterium]|nr:DUF2461 family protein [Saprospiraceae bacterium]